MKITAESKGHCNMVSEWDNVGLGPMRGKERGMGKPIEVATMLVCRAAGMGNLTWAVPLGCEVLWADIPISSHEPRDPTYTGEELLKLGEQVAAERLHLGVCARWPVH